MSAPKCDFCDRRPVVWAYATDEDPTEPGYHGSYAVCAGCATAIETGVIARLLRRSAKAFVADGTASSISFAERRMRPAVLRFWHRKTGERLPVDPADPVDPAHRDPVAEEMASMLANSNQSLELDIHKDDGDLSTTISRESIEMIKDKADRWVMAKMKRAATANGRMPQRVRVRVSVACDDEEWRAENGSLLGSPQQLAEFIMDGQTRMEVRDAERETDR